MSADKKRDYDVGYGRPPHHTRFKKGESGNPKGRPGGAKNLSTLINEALNERVIVAEATGQRKITKLEAIAKQLVNRAAVGDLPAVKILLDKLRDIESRTDPASSEISDFTSEDEKVIEQLMAQLRRTKRESDD